MRRIDVVRCTRYCAIVRQFGVIQEVVFFLQCCWGRIMAEADFTYFGADCCIDDG